MSQEVYQYIWVFYVYAFLGWCVEVIFHAVSEGKFLNRGFLNGPVCPIYGFGVLTVVVCLSPVKQNILLLFIGSVLLSTALEFITGFVLERFFNDKWWDYSEEPLNICGYVCIRFSLAWGLACLLVVNVIYPLTTRLVDLIPQTLGFALLAAFTLLILSDTTVTLIETLKLRRKLAFLDSAERNIRKVSDSLGGVIANRTLSAVEAIEEGKEALEQKATRVRTGLSTAQARILKVYPRLRRGRYKDSIAGLRLRFRREHGKPVSNQLYFDDPHSIVSDLPIVLYRNTFETVIDVLEARDEYTAGHSRRVAILTKHFCRILRMPLLESELLELSASLHDLGKVGVPDATLNKTGKLTDSEWFEMRRHPDIGADIILKSGMKLERVADIVRHHHEHWDGSGYPSGLKCEEIPKGSQIIAVCDAVDSMMIERVYRQALPADVCKQEILNGKGTLFCPELADRFIENWDSLVCGVYSKPDALSLEKTHTEQ
ncbi:MAG: HD domain-containing protein [Oscillospiraceae bacterium]|nr:HD domain-containing protein [Oscillospiraceae bacterium]